jgi:hypothetical protein
MYKILVEKILIDNKECTGLALALPIVIDSKINLKDLLVAIGKKEIGDNFCIRTEYPNIIVLGENEEVKIYVSRVFNITSMIELTNIVMAIKGA